MARFLAGGTSAPDVPHHQRITHPNNLGIRELASCQRVLWVRKRRD
jgi:hypothetical protein